MIETYPKKLIVLPLENKVLLPSVVLRLIISGNQAAELVKSNFSVKLKPTNEIYIACIPLKSKESSYSSTNFTHAPANSNESFDLSSNLVSLKDRNRLLDYGCLARIIQAQRSESDQFVIFVEGLVRFKVTSLSQNTPSMSFPNYWMTQVEYIVDNIIVEYQDIEDQFKQLSQDFIIKLRELQFSESLLTQLTAIINTSHVTHLSDFLICMIETSFEERIAILSTPLVQDRLKLAINYMQKQLDILQITNQSESEMHTKLTKKQREHYLRQQLETMGNESKDNINEQQHKSKLSYNYDDDDEITDIYRRLSRLNLPNEVSVVAQRELNRIKHLTSSSSEWTVSRNYLEWLADLPWNIATKTSVDIQHAKSQLDRDHFGLDYVKKRIIEYLSVIKIKGDLKAPIICLVGPPGVGKTSLAKSIAQSLSREFHRVALGGIKDEADIRGHRRTYVGSMPGLIIQGLRKCKVNNPLFLLDEIDKLVHNSKYGDPAAALLEVLDPEQNHSFSDHYLNVSFDLSKVLFIATANSLDSIPEPLLDRMEVIELSGYTFEEKLHIAKYHLIPKQISTHGLVSSHIKISDNVIAYIAENYTRESGVRNLERTLASVIRAKCVELVGLDEGHHLDQYSSSISVKDVQTILGIAKFEKQVFDKEAYPGVVTGLAYSSSGNGDVLFVEATKMPGDGHLYLTGSLGNIIQESARIALSWVKANAYTLNLTCHPKEKIVEHEDIHIHFPSGSIPKDGSSAGVTLVCAIVSIYSGRCVPTTTAMTGEITLRGQILPVGGIKEKVISAHRMGIRKVIIPVKNKTDVETNVPKAVCEQIEVCYVKNIWQVLEAAFDDFQVQKIMEESRL